MSKLTLDVELQRLRLMDRLYNMLIAEGNTQRGSELEDLLNDLLDSLEV